MYLSFKPEMIYECCLLAKSECHRDFLHLIWCFVRMFNKNPHNWEHLRTDWNHWQMARLGILIFLVKSAQLLEAWETSSSVSATQVLGIYLVKLWVIPPLYPNTHYPPPTALLLYHASTWNFLIIRNSELTPFSRNDYVL